MENKRHALYTEPLPVEAIRQPVELQSVQELDIFEASVYRLLDSRNRTVTEADVLMLGPPLRQEFRAKRFNGTLHPITITPIIDPVDAFKTAPERLYCENTKQLSRRVHPTIDKSHAANKLRAFTITAPAYSTGRGQVGNLYMEVWYAKLPKPGQLGPIKRYTTESIWDGSSVEALNLASRAVAERNHQDSLRRIDNRRSRT